MLSLQPWFHSLDVWTETTLWGESLFWFQLLKVGPFMKLSFGRYFSYSCLEKHFLFGVVNVFSSGSFCFVTFGCWSECWVTSQWDCPTIWNPGSSISQRSKTPANLISDSQILCFLKVTELFRHSECKKKKKFNMSLQICWSQDIYGLCSHLKIQRKTG